MFKGRGWSISPPYDVLRHITSGSTGSRIRYMFCNSPVHSSLRKADPAAGDPYTFASRTGIYLVPSHWTYFGPVANTSEPHPDAHFHDHTDYEVSWFSVRPTTINFKERQYARLLNYKSKPYIQQRYSISNEPSDCIIPSEISSERAHHYREGN